MNQLKYIDDLKNIKEMMNRSSRFISLSGLSGVFAGVFALIGAYFAYNEVYSNPDFQDYHSIVITNESLLNLLLIAALTALLAISSGIFFTIRKAKKSNQQLWDIQTKRLLINLFIPLLTGGILCLMLILKGFAGLMAPLTLIFYGLALVNASKYTYTELRSLGLVEIILGLFAMQFIGFGILFWAVGFGLLHIVYGIVMHIRYGS